MFRLRRRRFAKKRTPGLIWRGIKLIFRIITGMFVFFFVATLLTYFIAAIWMYWEFTQVPDLDDDSVLVFNLKGFIEDRPSLDIVSERLGGDYTQTQQEIVNNIRKAAADPRISGILLNMENYGMSATTAMTIHEELIHFKTSGKKVFAYMEAMGLQSSLLSSPADKIYMPPSGHVAMLGFRAEIPFFKGVLDNIGVAPEFVHIGAYKTAPQVFTMDHLSDEYRQVMNDMLDIYYENYVQRIATARGVAATTVKEWIDLGLYPAPEAVEHGIVDELLYQKEMERRVQVELGLREPAPEDEEGAEAEENGPELKTLNGSQYGRIGVDAPGLYQDGEQIALVYARGAIVSGSSAPPSSASPTIGSDTMIELFQTLADDDEIKGIILRVDSGGGGARASDLIRNAVQQASQKKPVVVSMHGAAASGGYMISIPAHKIVAEPLTLTGSIGIFGGKFSAEGLFDLIGLNIEAMQRGNNAGMFSSARTWTEEEHERFRYFIQQGYDEFVQHVADGRDMSFDDVDAIARGRVWMGTQAIEIGLVDELGGIDTAVNLIKQELEIAEDEEVKLVHYPKIKDPLQQFLDRLRETLIGGHLPKEIHMLQAQLETLQRLQEEYVFAWFPWQISVK